MQFNSEKHHECMGRAFISKFIIAICCFDSYTMFNLTQILENNTSKKKITEREHDANESCDFLKLDWHQMKKLTTTNNKQQQQHQ